MNTDHWILCGYWTLFSLMHSGLANERVKEFFRLSMQGAFKYYRLMYSIAATISLAIVVIFQYSVSSHYLPVSPVLKYFAGVPFAVSGLVMMALSIRKYFFNLSGVRIRDQKPARLEIEGMHKYVRHPLYLGTLLFVWAVFLFIPLLSNLLACSAITIYTLIGIKSEEKKLIQIFGKNYHDYIEQTPGLIPNVPAIIIKLFSPPDD